MELQYDGTGLHGWAKQDGLVTVEGCLEEALRTVIVSAPALTVAGRTDAGVHARRQVVNLLLPSGTDLWRLRASLNALTPPGIAVTRIEPAPETFDARRDAVSRSYRYYLSNASVVSPFWRCYCWHVPCPLDLETMGEAASACVGRHDFTAFTPTETEHVLFDRIVFGCAWREASETEAEGLFYLEIEAEAFLRHMVRVLVGTMAEVGMGKRSVDEFRRLLNGAGRHCAGPTALAQGLFLWDVKYGSNRPAVAGGAQEEEQ